MLIDTAAISSSGSAGSKAFGKYLKDKFSFKVREKTQDIENFRTSISGTKIPKIATPKFKDWGEIALWLGMENFPGSFPFTSGVFPFKREGEDPTRMFAGEGIAAVSYTHLTLPTNREV